MPTAADEIRFDDQVVLVTGAGRGIGRGHALLFAQRGAHVVVNDIDADVAVEVTREIEHAGGRATNAPGDIVDDAEGIVGVALDRGGRLDALVNNAGVAFCAPFGRDGAADVERLLRVHMIGTAALTTAAWDALVATGGRIVNTTSNAVLGLAHHAAYAAAKGAILGFTRALAFEAEPAGIKVNAIMPMARTRMYEIAGGTTGDEVDAMLSRHFPAEGIAPVALYLASREVACNGQVVEISAGTAAYVQFAVSPYRPAATPEEARAALADQKQDFTVCHSNNEMLHDKFTLLHRSSQ